MIFSSRHRFSKLHVPLEIILICYLLDLKTVVLLNIYVERKP